MKKTVLLVVHLLFIAWCLNAQNSENTLKISKSTPALGECNVDPNLSEITIEFTQDMSGGMSLVDCNNMPEINGRCNWKDSHTFSIPVKLEPNKIYHLLLNSNQFRGFCSATGQVLPSTDFYFSTRSDAKLQKRIYTEGFESFFQFFTKQYSHKDLRGIDWAKELSAAKENIINSANDDEFAVKLWNVLRKAEDVHLKIHANNQNFACSTGRLLPLSSNTNSIISQLDDVKNYSQFVRSGLGEGFIYLNLSSLNNEFGQQIYNSLGVIFENKNYPNLILDIRNNNGGNEEIAKMVVSNLITKSIVFEKVALYNPVNGKFDNIQTKTLEPDNNPIPFTGKIYVLINGDIVSSAESFVLMLRQMPNVKILGTKTYGSSGNPQVFKITNQISVKIPSWQAFDMNNKPIENNGIEPDEKIEFPAEQYYESDPLYKYVVTKYIKPFLPAPKEKTNPVIFPKLNGEGNVKDYEGNTYKTVKIGNQIWMAENLRSTKYSDGRKIENVHAYDDDSTFVPVYGYLYMWNDVVDSSTKEKTQGVCPVGWHVPSAADWDAMLQFVGGSKTASNVLKETGNSHWLMPNENSNNQYGFTALPGGRYPTPIYKYLYVYVSGSFWSSSSDNNENAWSYTLINKTSETSGHKGTEVSKWADPKNIGFSVRCIKNN